MILSSPVSETSDARFVADVLEASAQQPVVVDFWAPWCGPCRMIGPVLEKLAEEHAGAVRVVKLNTDENPRVATQLGIQSIPAVMAFRDGRVVNQFVGAIPEPEIRAFFASVLPSEADRRASEAARLIQGGALDAARAELEAALAADPNHENATVVLAALALRSNDLETAAQLAQRWPGNPQAKEILGWTALRRRARGGDRAALEARLSADANDAAAHYRLGALLAIEGQWQEALEHLLQTVRLDRSLDHDGGRLRLLDAFVILGDQNPLAQEYRRRLGSVLF